MQTMTPQAIREGFQNLRDGSEMAGLADAARSRSESDWLIGINGTRAITKRMFGSRGGNVASVGRVQTPTLAIVYDRELEIRNFKPHDYWRVTAKFEIAKGDYEGVYQRPDFKRNETTSTIGSTASGTKRWRKRLSPPARASRSRTFPRRKKASSQGAPRLYDLTTLQREANNRFGFSARRTLQIAQALYERHKMIHLSAHGFARAAGGLSRRPAGKRWETFPARCNAWLRRRSRKAGCGRTSASSTTRKSPITSPSSRPARRRSISMRWKRRFTT